MKTMLSLLAFSLLLGCAVTGKLYPIQTSLPMSSLPTSQPLIAKLKFVGLGKSGTISITLSTGEICSGPYSFIEPNPTTLDKNILSSSWDTIYGSSYYIAHVLGTSHAIAQLPGNQGNSILIDFYRTPGGEKSSQIMGVAKDNKSNLYKLVF